MKPNVPSDLWERVTMQPHGCWPCSFTPSQVYPVMKLSGKSVKAHIVSYTLTQGPVPDGLVVMHSCDNPRCVRPDHLDVGTHKDNTQDARSKGRLNGQSKERCIRGHSRWGRKRHGRRYCMECDREKVYADV